MTAVLNKWNEKWKNMRVSHAVTFSPKMTQFFANSKIVSADHVVHDYEYYDEGYYADFEVVVEHEGEKYTFGGEYGNHYSVNGESMDEFFEIDSEETKKIKDFFLRFDFEKMIQELRDEYIENGVKEREKSLHATLEKIETDEHGNFLYVLSDGRVIQEKGYKATMSQY